MLKFAKYWSTERCRSCGLPLRMHVFASEWNNL